MLVCCEHGDETLDLTECRTFLDILRDCSVELSNCNNRKLRLCLVFIFMSAKRRAPWCFKRIKSGTHVSYAVFVCFLTKFDWRVARRCESSAPRTEQERTNGSVLKSSYAHCTVTRFRCVRHTALDKEWATSVK